MHIAWSGIKPEIYYGLTHYNYVGKLTPNMVLLGFKNDWQNDADGLDEYIDVIHHGFDIQMAMGILRLSNGCDYSNVVCEPKIKKETGEDAEDAKRGSEDEEPTKNGGSDNSEDGK